MTRVLFQSSTGTILKSPSDEQGVMGGESEEDCCCDCYVGFLYKRFPDAATIFGLGTHFQLPSGDAQWPRRDVNGQACYSSLPYTHLHTVSSSWHIAGRVYDGGGGLDFKTGHFGPNGAVYYIGDGPGTGSGNDVYRLENARDPTFEGAVRITEVTGPNTQQLIGVYGDQTLPGEIGPLFHPGRLLSNPQLGDVRGRKMLLADAGRGGRDDSDRVVLIDLAEKIIIWETQLGFNLILTEDGIDPRVPGKSHINSELRINHARIGDDGDVYICGESSDTSGFTQANTVLLAGLWRLDITTGKITGFYGKYSGSNSEFSLENDPNAFGAIRLTAANHLDVDSSGSVLLSLSTWRGRAIAKLNPIPGTAVEDGGDEDRDGYVALGFEEEWVVNDGAATVLGTGSGIGIPTNGAELSKFRWPCHDGSGGAIYLDPNIAPGCIRRTDGNNILTMSAVWGVSPHGLPTTVSPYWMRRDSLNQIHTATAGDFLLENATAQCDVHIEPPNTDCCDNKIPDLLSMRRDGLFPGSGSLTRSDISNGGGGTYPAWSGTVTGSNCSTSVQLVCRPCGGGIVTCADEVGGPDPNGPIWHISLDGGPLVPLLGASCNPFKAVIPLDPYSLTIYEQFVLGCTTLVIGDADSGVDDVASLDVTFTFDPTNPALPNFTQTRTLTRDGCNSFSDEYTATTPCGDKTISISLVLAENKQATITVVVDGTDLFTGTQTYSCEPFSANYPGAAVSGFCSEAGSVSATAFETP